MQQAIPFNASAHVDTQSLFVLHIDMTSLHVENFNTFAKISEGQEHTIFTWCFFYFTPTKVSVLIRGDYFRSFFILTNRSTTWRNQVWNFYIRCRW